MAFTSTRFDIDTEQFYDISHTHTHTNHQQKKKKHETAHVGNIS